MNVLNIIYTVICICDTEAWVEHTFDSEKQANDTAKKLRELYDDAQVKVFRTILNE